jgi:murein DD-endopeptidase MepM/ murein hydrolase activator NlpD
MYLYFAHLETREVERGDQVRAGQQIGTVGNTGNARYTRPHLHFGIYSSGPIDPFHFIAETDTIPGKIVGDTLLIDEEVYP